MANFGPYCKHFWSCTEDEVATTITDVVGGANITAGLSNVATSTPNAVKMQVASGSTLDGALTDPMSSDWLAFSCGRSADDGNGAGTEQSFYYGGDSNELVVHSYIGRIQLCTGGVMAPGYNAAAKNLDRIIGQVYGSALCRRGDQMVFYSDQLLDGSYPADIVLRESVNPLTAASNPLAAGQWDNKVVPDQLYLGHGAFGTLADPTSAVENGCFQPGYTNYNPPQPPTYPIDSGFNSEHDYYGLAFFLFPPGGLPDDAEVIEALNWMKAAWRNGYKEIYPNWRIKMDKTFTQALPDNLTKLVEDTDILGASRGATDIGVTASMLRAAAKGTVATLQHFWSCEGLPNTGGTPTLATVADIVGGADVDVTMIGTVPTTCEIDITDNANASLATAAPLWLPNLSAFIMFTMADVSLPDGTFGQGITIGGNGGTQYGVGRGVVEATQIVFDDNSFTATAAFTDVGDTSGMEGLAVLNAGESIFATAYQPSTTTAGKDEPFESKELFSVIGTSGTDVVDQINWFLKSTKGVFVAEFPYGPPSRDEIDSMIRWTVSNWALSGKQLYPEWEWFTPLGKIDDPAPISGSTPVMPV